MRDRFDHTLERKLDPKPGGDVVAVPRRGIVTGPQRRREWPAAEKARIIVESLQAGANVSEVARRNGLSPQQLFGWRREARDLFAGDDREARAITVARHGDDAEATRATFVPVVATPASSEATPPPDSPRLVTAGAIEIMIGAIVVRVSGRVDAAALQTVIEIVRRLTCS